jgi:hypothetical protein
VEPLGPSRLVPVKPSCDLRPLLPIHGDQREALGSRLFLYIEQWLAVDRRQEGGEEPRRFEVPQDGDRRVSDGEVFPDPEDGDRARPPRTGSIFQGPASSASAAVRLSSRSRRQAR